MPGVILATLSPVIFSIISRFFFQPFIGSSLDRNATSGRVSVKKISSCPLTSLASPRSRVPSVSSKRPCQGGSFSAEPLLVKSKFLNSIRVWSMPNFRSLRFPFGTSIVTSTSPSFLTPPAEDEVHGLDLDLAVALRGADDLEAAVDRAPPALDREACSPREHFIDEGEVGELRLSQLDLALEILGRDLRELGGRTRLDQEIRPHHDRRTLGEAAHPVVAEVDLDVEVGTVAVLRRLRVHARGGVSLGNEARELGSERPFRQVEVAARLDLAVVDVELRGHLPRLPLELQPVHLGEVVVEDLPRLSPDTSTLAMITPRISGPLVSFVLNGSIIPSTWILRSFE